MRASIALVCVAALVACSAEVPGDADLATPRGDARAAAPTTRLVPSAPSVVRDRDCADFADRAAAQDALRADPRDPFRLDADDDALACERN